MKTKKVDMVILGAGSAGLNAAKEAMKHGKTCALIEGGPLGTTCARVGCMPSKLLIAAADAAHEVSRASLFGVHVDPAGVEVRAKEVFGRVRKERDRFVDFMKEDIKEYGDVLVRGWGKFDPKRMTRVVVDSQDVAFEGKGVVIATGSSPFFPPPYKPLRKHIMTNEEVFELQEIPKKMAVVGAGVIGLELGQALSRLGTEVHVFDTEDHAGPFKDPVLQKAANTLYAKEMNLHLGIETTSVSYDEEAKEFELSWVDSEGGSHTHHFDQMLMSAGRRPNLEGLGLEAFDELPRDDRGHLVSDSRTMQLGDSPLFFAGDVSGHRPLLHEAADEGRIAGHNALHYPDVMAALRRTSLAIAFTHPQAASFGQAYDELDRDQVCIGQYDYKNQGRARAMAIDEGQVRLYANKTTCVLVGGEMLGPRVEHTAHLLAWMTQANMRVQDILRMPFYHPVVEEGIRTALRDLAKQLQITSRCPPEDFALSAGL